MRIYPEDICRAFVLHPTWYQTRAGGLLGRVWQHAFPNQPATRIESLDAIPSVSSLNFIRETGLEAGVVGGDTRPL